MRPARTSVIYFLSDVATSLIGFVATVYFARELGPAGLGKYFVVLALVAWLSIPSDGIGGAIIKRVSEGRDRGAFLSAGFLLNMTLAIGVALGVLVFDTQFDAYVGAPVSTLFAVIFVGQVGFTTVRKGLSGQRMVAHEGVLKAFDRLVRVGAQVTLVVLGYGVAALVGGHAIAFVVSAVVGLVLFEVRPSLPSREHFREIYRYARYNWLGNMKGKTFSWMDTLVLSLFVGSGLIGVYEVAFRLASVLILVSNAVQRTLFPEMSQIAAEGDYDEIKDLLNEALFAAGLFVIPGLFGALILGRRILRIYGSEFVDGAIVLAVLIVARAINSYGTQLVNVINAIDRPEMAFRINLVFVVTNFGLNLGLVYLFGWIGAAVATSISAAIMLVLGFYTVSELIGVPEVPTGGIVQQVAAGGLMAVGVMAIRAVIPWRNMYVTVAFVLVGAAIYLVCLLVISKRFRRKTAAVLPGRQLASYLAPRP